MADIVEIDFDQDPAVPTEAGRENLPQRAEDSRVTARYGEAGKSGWSPIPDVLLFNQHQLGTKRTKLKGDDMVVLLNLMAHYYVKDEMPFIRPTTIAKRMGVSQRTVQRSLAKLFKLGLLAKGKHKELGHITYDLTPLVTRLQPLGEARLAEKKYRQELKRSVAQLDRAPGFDSRL